MIDVGSYWRNHNSGRTIKIIKVEHKEENVYYFDRCDGYKRVLPERQLKNHWVEVSEKEFKKDQILWSLKISS